MPRQSKTRRRIGERKPRGVYAFVNANEMRTALAKLHAALGSRDIATALTITRQLDRILERATSDATPDETRDLLAEDASELFE